MPTINVYLSEQELETILRKKSPDKKLSEYCRDAILDNQTFTEDNASYCIYDEGGDDD